MIYARRRLVYALADGSIMARPFDLRSLEVTGEAVRVASNAVTHNASDTEYAVSRSGTVVIRSGGTATENSQDDGIGKSGTLANMRLFPLAGPPPLKIIESPVPRGMPAFSPDGKRLAFVQARDATVRNTDVWVLDLATELTTRISSEPGTAVAVVWSADGKYVRWLQYGEAGTGKGGRLLTRPADLSGPTEPFAPQATPHLKGITFGGRLGLPSRSGGPIPFTATGAKPGDADLWMMDADGSNPRPFLQSPASERDGAVSPSGKWIAYTSDETGENEIWVEPFPRGGPRSRISERGGAFPVWVSDTQIAFVANGAVDLVALAFTGDHAQATDVHEVTNSVTNDWGTRPLDANPDGKSIMIFGVTVNGRLLVETNRVQQIGEASGS